MKRVEYVDLAKGLCIILVVLYHVCVHFHYRPDFLVLLSVFRMPLYFFLSGLFFKKYEGFIGFLLRKTNKLLIPFFFFYFITSFIMPNILYLCGFTVAHTQSLGISGLWAFIMKEEFANDPLWFLWCLFLMNIIFYVIFSLSDALKNEYSKYCIIIILLICFSLGWVGYYLSCNKIDLFGFIDSALSGLPFFALGYFFNKHTSILYPNKWDRYIPALIFACFLITFLFGGECRYKVNEYEINVFYMYFCGTAGTLGIMFIAKLVQKLPFVSYWGRYSIMILVSHGLLLQVVVPLLKRVHLPIPISMVIALIITMFSYQIIIPMMKKYLPYFTAQKDLIAM